MIAKPIYDVCMLGLGPVGTISGLCFAKQGFRVVGVDVNPERVAAFARGDAPFVEPGVKELLRECMEKHTFTATDKAEESIANSRLIMIAVGTPTPEETGIPDLSQLDQVAQMIGKAITGVQHEPIIVVRSTVPPGTMRNRLAPLIANTSGKRPGKDFHIAANPEFLREGRAIEDFFYTARVVIGADTSEVAEAIGQLYKDVEGKRLHVEIETAEFAKYVDNSWHAVKVTFANEIARVCQGFGGNPQHTSDVFLADDHLNISSYYLRPGFAFGGSCLPKDTRGILALARQHEVQTPMIDGVLESNEKHIDSGVAHVEKFQAMTIGLLGCAFKEYVDDLRESPALMVASKLLQKNKTLIAHDMAYQAGQELPLPRTKRTLPIMELGALVERSDMLVLMHGLPEYRQACLQSGKPFVDLTTVPGS